MRKKSIKHGKAIVALIIFGLIAFVALAASIYLLSKNTTIAQIFGGNDNVYESAHLDRVSINGYKLGDLVTAEIKAHRVMDADFGYFYNNVAFWANEDEKIIGLGFYSTSNAEGEAVVTIGDSDIRYNERRLLTISDFEEVFGIGEYSENEPSTTISYYQGNYKMTVLCRDGVVENVILAEQK